MFASKGLRLQLIDMVTTQLKEMQNVAKVESKFILLCTVRFSSP